MNGVSKKMGKQEQIIEMFDQIAPTYDSVNRILSLGIDTTWRSQACKKAFEFLKNDSSAIILDVACGTGDMVLHWEKSAKKNGKNLTEIIGVDPSTKMLEVAQIKLKDQILSQKVRLLLGEAKTLDQIQSNSVDILSIAYGLRNVVDIQEALNEFARVLKNGGVLVILEFTKKEKEGFLDKITSFYTKKILPLVGGMISRNYGAYRYLPNSVQDFFSENALKNKLMKVGIETKLIKGYSANISTLLIGVKS